jgi:hypothetical protein
LIIPTLVETIAGGDRHHGFRRCTYMPLFR